MIRGAEILTVYPEDAIEGHREYLGLSAMHLPQQLPGQRGVPSLPWTEYTDNRFGRDRNLFGRYEMVGRGGIVRADYRLHGVAKSLRYRYFDVLELFHIAPDGDTQHLVIAPSSIPSNVIDAESIILDVFWEFDFRNPSIRNALDALVVDPGTKVEVARVIMDVFKSVQAGQLGRALCI